MYYIFLFINLFLIIFSSANTNYKITNINREFEISRNGFSMGKFTIHKAGSLISVNDIYKWYDPPKTSSFSHLNLEAPYSVASFSLVEQIAPHLYRAFLSNLSPRIVYVQDNSINNQRILCLNSVLPDEMTSMYCPSSVTLGFMEINQKILSEDISKQSLSFNITNSTAEETNIAISLACYRLFNINNRHQIFQYALNSNEHRDSNSKVAVGLCWFCFTALLLSWMVLFVVWVTWVFPFFNTRNIWLFFTWFLFFLVITLLAVFAGRFFGMVSILCFYVLFSLILFITYICIKKPPDHEYTSLSSIEPLLNENDKDKGLIFEDKDHPPEFRKCPLQLGSRQSCLLWFFFIVTLLVILCILVIVYLWDQPDYYIWDRRINKAIIEIKPKTIKSSQALLYTFPSMSKWLHLETIWDILTSYCGHVYHEKLSSDLEKYTKIYEPFISTYQIDMNMYNPPDYRHYDSVNKWFIRHLKPGYRPVANTGNERIVVSPADSRVIIFPSIPNDLNIWIKGENFSLDTLLDVSKIQQTEPGWDIRKYTGGSMVIFRLAPQDYHRYHVPLSGRIMSQYSVEGTLESVSADSMKNDNDAIYNQRIVSIVKSPFIGFYSFIAIGASCVGSVIMNDGQGADIIKGQEFGYFQFGGSTVVIIFEKDQVTWDHDIVKNSMHGFETLVEANSRIGQKY